jgi:DivIVA domain-containing protein
MVSDKIKLSAKEILEKEFKTAMRGYKPEEVDKYLDMVIKDYESFQQEIEDLQQENLRLKKQLEEVAKRPTTQPAGTTNFDILKRLSNLEKHVFGNKLYD